MDAFHWFRNCFENLKFFLTSFLYFHNSCQIIASVAIIRSTPNCHQVFILKIKKIKYFKPINITLLNKLMGPRNQIDSVNVTKVISNFWSKYPTSASCINGPIFNIFRIRPHQITEWSFMRDFYLSIYCSDLINCLNLGTKTTVNTECFSINNSSNWQVVKNFSAIFPRVWVAIFSVDFIIKSIYCCDLSFVKNKITLTRDFLLKVWFCQDI